MINEIGVAGWEAKMVCGKKLDAPVTPNRRQQCEQSIVWVAVILNYFPCFPKVSCVVDALHGREMAASDSLRCLHHPLEGLVINSGAAAKPGSNAAREDALDGAPVQVSEGFCRGFLKNSLSILRK